MSCVFVKLFVLAVVFYIKTAYSFNFALATCFIFAFGVVSAIELDIYKLLFFLPFLVLLILVLVLLPLFILVLFWDG